MIVKLGSREVYPFMGKEPADGALGVLRHTQALAVHDAEASFGLGDALLCQQAELVQRPCIVTALKSSLAPAGVVRAITTIMAMPATSCWPRVMSPPFPSFPLFPMAA